MPWGDLIEDFLDTIGVSLEGMRDELTGGWMFGYVDALQRAGVETDLVCISARVDTALRWRHAATGAPILVLPAGRAYLRLRRRVPNPYAWKAREAIDDVSWRALPAGLLARQITSYLATPPSAVSRLLMSERYSAVVCQEYEYPRFDVCVALGKILKTPVFATFQGGVHHLTRLETVLRPHAVRACDGLIIGSKREAERVRHRYGVDPAKIARIFNPLDTAVWAPGEGLRARQELEIENNALVVAWHGRVDIYRKGLDVLCHAWWELCRMRRHHQLRLLLIGTGTDAPRLRRLIEDMRLPGVVWVDEYVFGRVRLRRYLSSADVYVFPSRHEGFPVAPIEAMACGLPVVAADAPGVADIIENGECSGGIIVPRADGPAMAAALNRILTGDGWRREMGERAKRRAHDAFAPDSVGRQLRDFLAMT
jgi:glycosyltransferase involved in cell wall biosynthesis